MDKEIGILILKDDQSMQTFFIVLILAFGFLITFQIAKASEYVAVLRGEEKARKQTNRINAFPIVGFPGCGT